MTEATGRKRGRPRKDDPTRQDGAYANAILGIGTRRDASSYTGVNVAYSLTQSDCENLYLGDGFAKKICDMPAEEMVRAGFEIENEAIEDDEETFRPVMARLEELDALKVFSDAVRWSRCYGGAVVVMGLKDGGLLEDELNEDAIKGVEFLRVYDRWQVSRQEKYTDPQDSRYGNTRIYMISPIIGGTPYPVHESRVMIFDGEPVPDRIREQNDGWGASSLQSCYDQLNRLGMSHQWGEKLLERAQQAVHGISGLTDILRSPGGEALIRQRVDLVDMSRSINNTVVIDANGESYEIKAPSIGTGVVDILDRFANALCAVSGIPESVLLGKQSKGLSGSDAGSLETWYSQVSKWQNDILLHPLDRLCTFIMRSLNIADSDYMIEFKPLWVPSEKECAETDKTKAEAKKIEAETALIYVTAMALDPSELRKTLRESGDYEMDATDVVEGEDDGEEENAIQSA